MFFAQNFTVNIANVDGRVDGALCQKTLPSPLWPLITSCTVTWSPQAQSI